eukprot:3471507-Amphidinium_carterae.1
MPDGTRAWLRIEDGYVQHQQPFWCELPQELTVGDDHSPDWEEEVTPKQLVPRPPKYRLRNRDVAAQEFCNRNADHTDMNQ